MGILTIPIPPLWDLTTLLPPRQPVSERWPLLALSLLAVYTISYLVHIPHTSLPHQHTRQCRARDEEKHPLAQWLCYALLPVALGCGGWFWLTIDLSRCEWLILLVGGGLDGSTRYRLNEPATSEWAAVGSHLLLARKQPNDQV